MQGGTVQCGNHLAFVEHNKQGKGERTAKIYKNNGSKPGNIVQGVNRVATGISIINVDHKAYKRNGETE